jgi:hypothetical protein
MDIPVKNATLLAKREVNANWNSAARTMDFWAAKRYAPNIPEGLLTLVEEARYFIHKYREFFSNVDLEQEDLDEYNQTILLNRALDVALQEWDTIRHALEQRENPRYQNTLTELDALAVECLSPLFGVDKIRNGIHTYIHKIFDIKRFAFSRTPLIGAPYEALHAPESWLAIPHETGHYIFWNGTSTFEAFNKFYIDLQNKLLGAIENALRKRITAGYFRRRGETFHIWLNWLNEIFADIFGTLVAGPAFAWSIQSRIRARITVRDLYHSHEEPSHPDPFLRPFFHIQTLRQMAEVSQSEFADQLREEANNLDKSWKTSWHEIDSKILEKLPTPDSIGTMSNILEHEVPYAVINILNASLGENLDNSTLLDFFKNGVLYNSDSHNKINQIAEQLVTGERVSVDSPLLKSAAAQMAIVKGAEPIQVHQALGFEGPEETPEGNFELEAQFNEFLQNVTGQDTWEKQLDNWRRVLNYSLDEVSFHWHTHNHYH